MRECVIGILGAIPFVTDLLPSLASASASSFPVMSACPLHQEMCSVLLHCMLRIVCFVSLNSALFVSGFLSVCSADRLLVCTCILAFLRFYA